MPIHRIRPPKKPPGRTGTRAVLYLDFARTLQVRECDQCGTTHEPGCWMTRIVIVARGEFLTGHYCVVCYGEEDESPYEWDDRPLSEPFCWMADMLD